MSITSRYGLLRQNHKTNLKKFLFKARMLTRRSWFLLHVAKNLFRILFIHIRRFLSFRINYINEGLRQMIHKTLFENNAVKYFVYIQNLTKLMHFKVYKPAATKSVDFFYNLLMHIFWKHYNLWYKIIHLNASCSHILKNWWWA